nr:hypothetical protein [Bacteroidota bacterium]
MDDYIYFLLLVGWLGYSLYRQSEKKKRNAAARNAASQTPEKDTLDYVTDQNKSGSQLGQEISKPDFRKTLEKILLGEELSLEEIPEEEAQSLETIPEPVAPVSYNKYQEYYQKASVDQSGWQEKINDPFQDEDKSYELDYGDDFHDGENRNEECNKWFDLRKAVIYSEILSNKYVH